MGNRRDRLSVTPNARSGRPIVSCGGISLVNLSQCFTWPQYAARWGPGYRLNDRPCPAPSSGSAKNGATRPKLLNELAALWTRLIAGASVWDRTG